MNWKKIFLIGILILFNICENTLIPILNCDAKNDATNTCRSTWGYTSDLNITETIAIGISPANYFNGSSEDMGQPTTFYSGENDGVLVTNRNCTAYPTLTWNLPDGTATSNPGSIGTCSSIITSISCMQQYDSMNMWVQFNVNNTNDFGINIPLGSMNFLSGNIGSLTGSPFTFFDVGYSPNLFSLIFPIYGGPLNWYLEGPDFFGNQLSVYSNASYPTCGAVTPYCVQNQVVSNPLLNQIQGFSYSLATGVYFTNEQYGSTIMLNQNYMVMGAYNLNLSAPDTGFIVGFARGQGNNWNQIKTVYSPNPTKNGWFGKGVFLHDGFGIGCAPRTPIPSTTKSGICYIIRGNATYDVLIQMIHSQQTTTQQFGHSVVMVDMPSTGQVVIFVGVPYDDGLVTLDAGSVEIFVLNNITMTFSFLGVLTSSDIVVGDNFGFTIGVAEQLGSIIVGAPGKNGKEVLHISIKIGMEQIFFMKQF